jgi:hypothetical protein
MGALTALLRTARSRPPVPSTLKSDEDEAEREAREACELASQQVITDASNSQQTRAPCDKSDAPLVEELSPVNDIVPFVDEPVDEPVDPVDELAENPSFIKPELLVPILNKSSAPRFFQISVHQRASYFFQDHTRQRTVSPPSSRASSVAQVPRGYEQLSRKRAFKCLWEDEPSGQPTSESSDSDVECERQPLPSGVLV